MNKKHKNVIVGINLGDFGSTGIIMRNSLEYANKNGDFDYLVIVPRTNGKPNTFAYLEHNSIIDKIDRRVFHKSLGNPDGLYEYRATKRIVNKIKEKCNQYDNVLIHLHNIHMASIDFRILFRYLYKERKIKNIFYTIHDCWPYTGGCYCYSFIGCNEWQNGCKGECAQKYGTNRFNTARIFELKRDYTLLLKDKMILFPVSNWINDEINKSILGSFKKNIITGETNIKKLDYKDKNLIKLYSIENKKVVMTVSSYWNEWKGTKYIYEVAKLLPEDYVVFVIGGSFDSKGMKNIIHVKNISTEELAHYFSIADVYMSTSQNESLGLTTCEAQICGVPVVAFGHTAIKETFNRKTGIIVGEDNNAFNMVKAIITIVDKKPFNTEDIIRNGNKFAKYSSSKKYFSFYLNAVE